MSWDAFQREVLAELGHVPYLPLRAQAAVADIDLEIDIDAGMLARIARAAGIDADALLAHADIVGDLEQQLSAWDTTSHLRGDAAAKRALWPRLRRLRADARRAMR